MCKHLRISVLVMTLLVLAVYGKDVGYKQKRGQCSNWKCRNIDKNQKMKRDMCIYQCIDKICYQKSYGDLSELKELPAWSKQDDAIQRENRKKQFLECYEGVEVVKNYADLRSDCSRWTCGDVDKEPKMLREQCIHECVSANCYYQVYSDIDGVVPDYPNSKAADEDLDLRKQKFKECFESKGGDSLSGQKLKKIKKPYQELRSDCSAKACKNIDKNDLINRDLCLHKCISPECFAMAYDIDTNETVFETPEEEEEDRILRKQVFVQCVEVDVFKNVEERKEGCVYRGHCKDLEKHSIEREVCVHECAHPECFEEVYSTIRGKSGELEFETNEMKFDLQREGLKVAFTDCVEKDLPPNRQSKKYKSYPKKKNECAPQCLYIEKEKIMERELCIHKCVNITCYWQIYSEFNLTDHNLIDTQTQEQQRMSLKQDFAQCTEADFPKEMKCKKYARRLRTCQWKYAFQTLYMNQSDADTIVYKCISEQCFHSVFKDFIQDSNLTEAYQKTYPETRDALKSIFIDCYEQGGPNITKTYRQLRIECVTKTCFLIDKDKKLERDMCVHRCIDQECFQEVYADYVKKMPKFEFKTDEEADQISKKALFKKCMSNKIQSIGNMSEQEDDEDYQSEYNEDEDEDQEYDEDQEQEQEEYVDEDEEEEKRKQAEVLADADAEVETQGQGEEQLKKEAELKSQAEQKKSTDQKKDTDKKKYKKPSKEDL